MKRLFTLLLALVGCTALSAQTHTADSELSRAVVVRATGNFTMVNVHFPEFPNRFQLGGGASLAATYEHPIATRGIIGAGLGGSIEKTSALDPEYYYRTLTLSSVYAEVYYGYIARSGFFMNLGFQGGYTPPVLSHTAAPDYEGGLKLRRLSKYACKAGNVWFTGRVGYTFGSWEVALALRYAMVSPFGEAFSYPMLTAEQESSYRDVLSRHLSAGISFGYRFGL